MVRLLLGSLEKLVEVDRAKDREAKEAVNFRARLLGLIYEGLLEQWFEESGYEVKNRDVRRGLYRDPKEGDKKVAVDFILKRKSCGKRFIVEAKCWPSYNEGKFKILTLNTFKNLMRRKGRNGLKLFLRRDFLNKYTLDGKKFDGKILVWWDVKEEDVEAIKQQTGLSEIVELKTILKSETHKFRKRLEKYEKWTREFFQALKEKNMLLQRSH